MLSAISPYWLKASSSESTVRLWYTKPSPVAATPLRMNRFRESKVPIADSFTLPPLGASAFT